MTQVFVVGGGRGGSLLQGPGGVRALPPFDQSLRDQFAALAGLLRASARLREPRDRKATLDIARRLSSHVVGQVEAVVGPVDGEAGLVYQDDDGGFTCGSTGKPPIPIPWPPSRLSSVEDIVGLGTLERELGQVFERAPDLQAMELLEHPAQVSKRLGVKLSERTVEQLERIAPSKVKGIEDPAVREVLTFFHEVLGDKRFIETWSRRPYEVARELGVELSPRAIDLILAGGNVSAIPGTGPVSIIWIVVVIVVGVLVVADNQITTVREFVIDKSGAAKL